MDTFFAAVPLLRKTRIHFHEFMRGVHRELHELKGQAEPLDAVAQRIAARWRLICFDEFHVSDIADAMILHRLLQRLFELRVGFVMTSNYAPDGLYPDGLHRERVLPAIELLKAQLDVLQIDAGVDYRQRVLERIDAYLTPLSPETDAPHDRDVRGTDRSRGRRSGAADRGAPHPRDPPRGHRRMVRFPRALRRTALAERLSGDRRALPHGTAVERAADVGRAGVGGAPVHVARRRVLRPRREADRVGRRPRRRRCTPQACSPTSSSALRRASSRCSRAATWRRRAAPWSSSDALASHSRVDAVCTDRAGAGRGRALPRGQPADARGGKAGARAA